jgi:hypothetical protein
MSSGLTYNEPVADASMVACSNCDLVQRLPILADGASVMSALRRGVMAVS